MKQQPFFESEQHNGHTQKADHPAGKASLHDVSTIVLDATLVWRSDIYFNICSRARIQASQTAPGHIISSKGHAKNCTFCASFGT